MAQLAPAVRAQDVRPGQERLDLPSFEDEQGDRAAPILPSIDIPGFDPPPRERGDVLPPVVLPEGEDTEGLEAGRHVRIERISITGGSVFTAEELATITQPYLGRPLAFGDLETLRNELTSAYIERGYVSSGAIIPSQSLADGVLEVRLVEGFLAAIDIENEGRLRDHYLVDRIELGADSPVNVDALEERLQLLQQDRRIRTVTASLLPGERLGESILRVRVVEARPWEAHFSGNNYSAPSLGGWRGEVRLAHRNLSGWGDTLLSEYKGSHGLNDVMASYQVPLTAWDTTVGFHMRRTWSEVVEGPFRDLDIGGETETYGFRISQSLYRTIHSRLDAFLIGEYRSSTSSLLGRPFSFVPGPVDGVAKMTVVRFGSSFSSSSRTRAVALRTLFSFGVDLLDATIHGGDTPDGEFFSWLGQAQFAQRFPAFFDVELLARADVQLADRPLLGLEQFVVGGRASVRGYLENQLVRDNGLVGSLELRIPIPLPYWREWRPRLELAPFVDAGYSWNRDRPDFGPTTLVSVGVGGRLALTDELRFEIYWGHPLKDIPKIGDAGLQDDGISLELTWRP